MARPEVVALAKTIRSSQERAVQRHGRQPAEAVVRNLDPLRVEVLGSDLALTDDDVTITRALARLLEDEPLAVGDTLVLVEVDSGDYDAVDVLPAEEE